MAQNATTTVDNGRIDTGTAGRLEPGRIAYCRIHPGLGIARLGNSPNEFFIGPEVPGQAAAPVGGFKDKLGRIKRQAARFRLYAFDKDDVCLGEITAADGTEIAWTAHLVNRKAEFETFRGRFWQSQYPNFNKYDPTRTPLRNQEIMDPDQRAKLLVIDPGPRTIKPGDEPVEFDDGTIGPLPYPNPPSLNGSDPLAGTRAGWWNCAKQDRMPTPIVRSRKREVPLGTLRTDSEGRLLVLGGYGNSDSVMPDNPISRLMGPYSDYYANNDYWFDDTSDGPVSAEVKIGGKAIPVQGTAWVLAVPPKFAPDFQMITTLYDTAMETWDKKNQNGSPPPPQPVSFTRDIYPILARIDGITWLNRTAYQHHGANTNNDFANVNSRLFQLLHGKQPATETRAARRHVFERLRKPGLVAQEPPPATDTDESLALAGFRFMPQMSGDGGQLSTPDDGPASVMDPVFDCASGAQWNPTGTTTPPPNPDAPPPGTLPTAPGGYYITWLTLSERQYAAMEQWAKGDFVDDWRGLPPVPDTLESIPLADQPKALDKAALEWCIGAPFYPGIEMTYIATHPDTWSGPCRINPETMPGGITCHMALPWQADFSECNTNWWPTARPDDVVTESELENTLAAYDPSAEGGLARALSVRLPWARGIPDQSPALDNAMVTAWSHFGFVVRREVGGQDVYVETERSPYFGSSERDFFYYLMNSASFPDFMPRAHQLVHEYLAQGRRNMHDTDTDEVWRFFPFSQDAFDSRMELIYANFVRDNQATANPNLLADNRAPNEPPGKGFQPQSYLTETNREQQAYQLLQMGPFNQLDGAWLRRVIPDGPVEPVCELLAQIRQDELGDGETAQNHANVYTDLLKSLNFYLPDLHTRAYADDPRLLDAAFTQPCFLLAISQFDDEFLPEILGMTLYLEWSSIALIATVNTLEAFGINPLYYSLHVGIDNAASGHGALAKRAVGMYLDQVRAAEGDAAMQEAWERIWTGYVTFGTLGNLADAINQHFAGESLAQRVQDLIRSKAPCASQTHGEKMLGNSAINDWFLDPPGMMQELQDAGLIVPGNPEASPFFRLLSFTGPMFHVFTADEVTLLRDWCSSLTDPDTTTMTLFEAMNYVIDKLRQRQTGEAGHNVRITGPDPAQPAGAKRTEPLHWWFAQGNEALMAALSDPDNGWIVPYDSVASPINASLLAGTGDMADAFRSYIPGQVALPSGPATLTYGNVLAYWIDAGCPLTDAPTAHLMAMRAPTKGLPPPVHRAYRRRHGKVWGMGTPH